MPFTSQLLSENNATQLTQEHSLSGEYSEMRSQILFTELFPKNCDSTSSFENWHYSSLLIRCFKMIKILKFTTGMENAIKKHCTRKRKVTFHVYVKI